MILFTSGLATGNYPFELSATDGARTHSRPLWLDTNTIPTPARNLRVGPSVLQWEAPVAPGGNSVVYDVLRSADPSDFGSAACIESGQTDPVAIDTETPEPNELYCYLVRARNDCGGTLGVDSQSTPRVGADCP